jgi:enterochelin esterase-like enzyme
VERIYRVKPGAENRAIAGLSMGAAQALAVGLKDLDKFAYVGAFSPGGGNNSETVARLDPAEANRRLKLLWIGCGRQDAIPGLFAGSEKLSASLKAKGITHVWHPTDGGHTWLLWRKYLADVLPLLFR